MAPHRKLAADASPVTVSPIYTRPGRQTAPRGSIPDAELAPDTAYQLVPDELMLDGNARLNVATFATRGDQ